MKMCLVKYTITIKDIMRGSLFDVECEDFEELKNKYKRYSNDSDYEVIHMHSVLLEIRPIHKDAVIEQPM